MRSEKVGAGGVMLVVLLVFCGLLIWGRGWLDRKPSAVSNHVSAVPLASVLVSGTSGSAELGPGKLDPSAANVVRARLRELRSMKSASATDASSGHLAPSASPTPLSPVATAGAGRTMPEPSGVGDQSRQALGEYVRATVRTQFLPMAGGCYEELRARDPKARGVLNLSVVVGGHPSVGGVVERVTVLPDSTLSDASLTTCMIESMMALEFDAPPGGRDQIDFTYPFQLSPDEPGHAPAPPVSSH